MYSNLNIIKVTLCSIPVILSLYYYPKEIVSIGTTIFIFSKIKKNDYDKKDTRNNKSTQCDKNIKCDKNTQSEIKIPYYSNIDRYNKTYCYTEVPFNNKRKYNEIKYEESSSDESSSDESSSDESSSNESSSNESSSNESSSDESSSEEKILKKLMMMNGIF